MYRQSASWPFERLEPIVLLTADTWTGGANDGLWATAGNWSNGVPTSYEDIFIATSGVDVTLSSNNTLYLNSLTIGDGATLTINGGGDLATEAASSNSGTIEISGSGTTFGFDMGTNSGTLSAASGAKLNLSGTNWSNAGAINVTGSKVNLGGSFTQAGLGDFTRDAASTVNLTGKLTGDLALDDNTGSWSLTSSGTLSGGAFSAAGSATLTATGGTLNAETLNSPIDINANNPGVWITGGLTLNTTLDVGSADGTIFDTLQFNTETLSTSSSGTIVFGSNYQNSLNVGGGNTLTIAPGITIQGAAGQIGQDTGAVINQGTIEANASSKTVKVVLGTGGQNQGTLDAVAGGSLGVYGDDEYGGGGWTNAATGVINITGGGTLTLDNKNVNVAWSNAGAIGVAGSKVNLGGSFTQAGLGDFTRDAASTVNLTGKLTGDLALDDNTGSWSLTSSGTLSGGAFSAAGSATLTATGGTLNAETLNSPIDINANNPGVWITGGLTLNTTLDVGSADGTIFDTLQFNTETLSTSSSGTIVFGSNYQNSLNVGGGNTLTIAPGITIQGAAGQIGQDTGAVINQGTIEANASSKTMKVVLGTGGQNQGTLDAVAGGSLGVYGDDEYGGGGWTNAATGVINITGGGTLTLDNKNVNVAWSNAGAIGVAGSKVNLGGIFTQAGLGDFTRDAASTVNLTGKLTGDLALDDNTGSWSLTSSGTLSGGAFSAAGSATLTATGGTLNAETLNSPIDINANNPGVWITGGLTLNTTLDVGSADGTIFDTLQFNTETLSTSRLWHDRLWIELPKLAQCRRRQHVDDRSGHYHPGGRGPDRRWQWNDHQPGSDFGRRARRGGSC